MPKQLCKTVFCSTLLLSWVTGAFAQSETLVELFELGREAFLSRDFVVAAEYFTELSKHFASEPEFIEPGFQKIFLSMFGMSALFAGDAKIARSVLSSYMDHFYGHTEQDAILLIAYIQACRSLEEYQKLDALYARFLKDFPGHPDFHLIKFERMQMLFQEGDLERGMHAMEDLWNSVAPKDMRFRGRLMGLQRLIETDHLDEAGALLLTTKWDLTSMPELAVLATSALRLGEFFMQQEQWEQAIQMYRWVPFYRALLDTQRRRLRGLESAVKNTRSGALNHRTPLWETHYQNLLLQVKSQLEQLEAGEDYTPVFLLKYGRCFLFSGQYAEAWVIFRSLALSVGITDVMEEQAWYHWILASHGAENWDEARELCMRFAEHFPNSDLLPKTIYMLARTLQESGDAVRANAVLSDLIERFGDHEDVAEWLVTRGFNLASLNHNHEALRDFDAAICHPSIVQSLLLRAKYWRAVTLSALKQYDAAIEGFKSLKIEFPDHWMYPEFEYRLASVHYSKREYKQSEAILTSFLQRYPDHFYAPEVKVLLGDVAMGNGELELAIEWFYAISQKDEHLYLYACFQIGKIFRAREQYDKMEHHFRAFLDLDEFAGKARTSEALYWLGWALMQQGRDRETIPLYLEAIDTFGDDPTSGELIPMLQTLEMMKRKLNPTCTPVGRSIDERSDTNLFTDSASFEQWLLQRMQAAQREGCHTLFARLQLYEALKFRSNKQLDLARSAIQGISLKTPIEAMDDQLLGEIGLSLSEDGFEACREYLQRLLSVCPTSPYRALAYYGLAVYAAGHSKWEDALSWLGYFQQQTPSHERAFDVQLLLGQVLMELQRFSEATESYDALLRLKTARGQPHVQALLGLARVQERNENPTQAVAYYQRIYTLYRAYRPFVAIAYLQSAMLFESLGDMQAALRTLQEFLEQGDLVDYPEYSIAEREFERLQAICDVQPFATDVVQGSKGDSKLSGQEEGALP